MNLAQIAVDGVEKFGEYESWHFEGKWYTNAEMVDRGSRLATVLRDKGVRPGDRVLVMMESCMDVPDSFHAIARIGAVTVPIMPQLIAREVRYIVENSGAETVLTSPGLAPRIAEATDGIDGFRQILVFGDSDVDGTKNIAPLVDDAEPTLTLLECDNDDLAVLIYTSGTTGHPKGVMLSHGNLIANVKAVSGMFQSKPRERMLMVLPMSHVYGMLLMYLGSATGNQTILLRGFTPDGVLQAIQEFRIVRAPLVPAMQVALTHYRKRRDYDTSSLKFVVAGSAPLTEEVRSAFAREFNCRVVDGYGQSETTCAVCGYADDEEFVTGSAGRALPGIEVCIQDDDNQILPPGETGEICVRGPSIMQGYWKNEEATRNAVIDGWLHSGDIGHMDERGYISITDRKKDLIIKGGENISPREIEEAIIQMPSVLDVSVYSVPDPKFQEEIAATVIVRPGDEVTEDDIRAGAAKHVTKFKIPKYVSFADALPRNSNGKVLKRVLRDQWATQESKDKS